MQGRATRIRFATLLAPPLDGVNTSRFRRIAMAAILVMAAIGVWAVGTRQISHVVTYGISMNPVYYAGDLVVVIKADSYEVGQIAAYHGVDGRTRVLHRIISGDSRTGFVFKGDNNDSTDVLHPKSDEIIGRAVFHIPKIGTWVQPLLSPTSLGMLSFLFVGGGAAVAKTRREIPRGRRKKRVNGMSGQGGSWAVAVAVFKAVSRLHPALRVIAFMALVCGVLGIGLGALGWMKPATESVKRPVDAGESMTFSYSASVPPSAAYDGTTVHSPDPIFRKLADAVDLHMAYRGEPGRLQVNARLSAQSGWHSTLQLSQPFSFSSERYTNFVKLDLSAFDNRVNAAAKAIGADLGQVAVDITAEVVHADGSTFSPKISLAMSPLQMTLNGGADSLVVTQSGAAAGATVQDRWIGAFGRDVLTATQARRYAVFLLMIAVVGAVGIAMTALRNVPLRTRAQIQRRYPHLLVPVEPMASPPGKPVVIVDTFPALVKLAEKYGQMILTWTRPDGSDDFIVRDEGITYRYRITPGADTTGPALTAEPTAPPRPRATAGRVAPALPAAPEAVPEVDEAAQPKPVAEPQAADTPEQEAVSGKATEEEKAAEETTAPTAPASPAKRTRRPRPKPAPEQTTEPIAAEPVAAEPAVTAPPTGENSTPEAAIPDVQPKEAAPDETTEAAPEAQPVPAPETTQPVPHADQPVPVPEPAPKPAPHRKPRPRKAPQKATKIQEPAKKQSTEPQEPAAPEQARETHPSDDRPLVERISAESLAHLNKRIGSAPAKPAETPLDPLTDFLPAAKRPENQDDGATGR